MNKETIIPKIKERLVAIICLVVALPVGGYAFTRGGVITGLEGERDTLTRQVTLIDSNIRASTDLAEQVAALEELVSQMDDKLFAAEARAININFFYQFEERNDVRVVQARQGGLTAGGPQNAFSTIDFTLAVEGTYNQLLEFIYSLYNVDPFISVVRFEIQPAGGRGSSGQLSMGLTVRVLARKS